MIFNYGVHIDAETETERRVHSLRCISDEEMEIIATALHVATRVLFTRLPNPNRARQMTELFQKYMADNESFQRYLAETEARTTIKQGVPT